MYCSDMIACLHALAAVYISIVNDLLNTVDASSKTLVPES